MTAYWVTFEDRDPACVIVEPGGDEERALFLAGEATENVPLSAKRLPYPSRNQIGPYRDEGWCHSPSKCAGHSSCPNRYACSN